jgi:hypothetical protein
MLKIPPSCVGLQRQRDSYDATTPFSGCNKQLRSALNLISKPTTVKHVAFWILCATSDCVLVVLRYAQNHHRDTENTENAQRRSESSVAPGACQKSTFVHQTNVDGVIGLAPI